MKNKDFNIDEMLDNLVDNGEKSKYSIYQEVMTMKQSNKRRVLNWKTAVVTGSLVLGLTVTGFTSKLYGVIKESFLPGGSGLTQEVLDPENKKTEIYTVPENISVFDEDGKRVYEISYGDYITNKYYTEDGKLFVVEEHLENNNKNSIETTLEAVSDKLTFIPYVLNDNYKLIKVEQYHDSNASEIDILSLEYKGEKGNIYLQERENSEKNRIFTGGEGEIIEKTVDGVKLLIQDDKLWFEKDNTAFYITYKNANTDDLVKLYNDFVEYK